MKSNRATHWQRRSIKSWHPGIVPGLQMNGYICAFDLREFNGAQQTTRRQPDGADSVSTSLAIKTTSFCTRSEN